MTIQNINSLLEWKIRSEHAMNVTFPKLVVDTDLYTIYCYMSFDGFSVIQKCQIIIDRHTTDVCFNHEKVAVSITSLPNFLISLGLVLFKGDNYDIEHRTA